MLTGLVAAAIDRAVTSSGMPAGVFNMIYGARGRSAGQAPAIQAVGFTGSLRGGRALCDMAAARPQPIPVFAEMSSINPVILMPQALQARGEQVATELAASVVLGCGQFCTNPGLVVGIRSPHLEHFRKRWWHAWPTKARRPCSTRAPCAATRTLCSTCWRTRVSSIWPANRKRVTRPAAVVQGRRPAAQWRPAVAGRSVRPFHRGR
jgi:acyl-CoA reductase-like NAD-dependent aldehyde dehydrogenase